MKQGCNLIKPDTKKAVVAKSDPRAEMPALLREADPNERMAHLIKLASRGLSRGLQTRLRKHSILYGHWTLLRILWRVDGMTQRQLSEQAGVTEPTAFGALQAMEKLGFVTRQKMPDNGKQIRIFLTAKGAALKSLIVPAAEECNRIALAGIAENDMAVTRRTLLTIIENLVVNDLQMSEMSDETEAEEADKEKTKTSARRKDAA
ncbi:MAG TPA: MarR family transcriptional regulator [Herbaspirillum sp.]|jgi:DNA-binding MarR family transcriptional regulator